VALRHLTVLKLSGEDLVSPDACEAVKSAFRREAKVHHPDHDGQAAMFRKVREAYEELTAWLEQPVVRTTRGLPEKWCFNGSRWIPPMGCRQR